MFCSWSWSWGGWLVPPILALIHGLLYGDLWMEKCDYGPKHSTEEKRLPIIIG
jgi:hypothetical protein